MKPTTTKRKEFKCSNLSKCISKLDLSIIDIDIRINLLNSRTRQIENSVAAGYYGNSKREMTKEEHIELCEITAEIQKLTSMRSDLIDALMILQKHM